MPAGRRRRALHGVLWVFLGVLVLLSLLITWALATSSGARWLLKRADAAMPAELVVGELDGNLLRGLRIGGFRFSDDGVRLDARRLEVDLRILPLLAKRVHVDRVFVDGAKLSLWPSKKADEPYMAMVLPVRLRLDEVLAKDLVIEGLTDKPQLVQTLAFAGTWVGTRVELERLVLQAPQGRLAFSGDVELANLLALEGRGTLAWRVDGVDWRAALATQRHPDGTGVGLAITAPLKAQVTALLAGDHASPRWQARVNVPAQTLSAAVTKGAPLRMALDLRGGGVGLNARVSGAGSYDGERFALSRGEFRSTPKNVFVDALELALPDRDARVAVSGRVQRDGKRPDATLRIDLERLPLPQAADADGPPAVLEGRIDVSGWIESYAAQLRLRATREQLRADIDAKIDGTPERVRIEQLRVASANGALDLKGEVGLVKGAPWDLRGSARGFDPSIFSPTWPGAIDARVAFTGKRGEMQPLGTLVIDGIGGTLRDRPISGEVGLELGERGRFAGKGTLRSGASRVAFSKPGLAEPRIAIELDVRSLADLLPNARGRIEGTIDVDVDATPPEIEGNLTGSDLEFDDFAVGNLSLVARAPRGGAAGRFELLATAIVLKGADIDRLQLDADGTAARHSASLTIASPELDLLLRADGGFAARVWAGRLTAFDLAPRDLETWSLLQPVAITASAEVLDMGDPGVCVTAETREACVDLGWNRAGDLDARWNIERLPSALLARALELAGIADIEMDSELSSRGSLTRSAGGALTGNGRATLTDGRIIVQREVDPVVVAVRDLELDFDARPDGLRATLGGAINDSGRVEGTVMIGPALAPSSALSGQVTLQFDDLSWLEALSADIAAPRGRFEGRFALAGTLGNPLYSGEARLSDFFVEIPEYNLRLREADVRITANADRSFAVSGSVLSGRDGSARIEGRIDPTPAAAERLRLHITGDNFLAANRPDLMLRVTPDVTIVATAERFDIQGSVSVPRARIDLSRIEGGRRRSSDVVVIDDPVVEREDLPIWTDLDIIAGEQVDLTGFGLDGRVKGNLRVRNRPGRESTGQGTLNVTGKYEAYAQRLDIVRGRVVFNRTPLDNPRLDIRATRRVGTVTVGIQVNGSARAPDSRVFSSPAMDQSDALAYLVIGRPLRSASGADTSAIANAAGSLGGASGDLLSKSLGARMGLGDLGEPTAAFTMGRWLSPRLYLSYGLSGLDAEPVFSLRYLIRDWLEVETVVGTEVRAGVNYRRER